MNNFESLLFYIITFVVSAIILNYAEKNKMKKELKILITLIGLSIPIVIGGIRYNVGTDYTNYIDIFNLSKIYESNEYLGQGTEILFYLIVRIAVLFNNSQVLFWLFSFLTIAIMYKTITDNNRKLSTGLMVLLFLFLYYTTSFNIMRQALAVVIIAYSYKFIFNKDLIKFILAIIIASMFHITALLFLPFYWVNSNNKKIKKIVQILMIFALIAIIFNYNAFISILSNLRRVRKI